MRKNLVNFTKFRDKIDLVNTYILENICTKISDFDAF